MNIGNEKVAVVIFLHFQKTTHGTEIISEVQISGWPDATDNYLFGHDFRSKMGCKNTRSICISQELVLDQIMKLHDAEVKYSHKVNHLQATPADY